MRAVHQCWKNPPRRNPQLGAERQSLKLLSYRQICRRSEAAVLKELEDARAWLAEVERKEAKFGAGELARAIERYDKARAEYVVGDIHKFVLEQTALFEKRAEITGSFEKIRKRSEEHTSE